MNVARVYQAEKSVQSHYPRGQKKESHGYTWVKGKKARGKTQVHKFIILTRRVTVHVEKLVPQIYIKKLVVN